MTYMFSEIKELLIVLSWVNCWPLIVKSFWNCLFSGDMFINLADSHQETMYGMIIICLYSTICHYVIKIANYQVFLYIRSWIFTFGCCILLRIYPTGSLWCRQSQQSFNMLTRFYFPSHHMFRPLLQVRYTIRYF
jgi:hypothetical protein